MSKSASIRARMDPQLKEEAETILHELGMSRDPSTYSILSAD